MVDRYPDWANLRTLWHSARSAIARKGTRSLSRARRRRGRGGTAPHLGELATTQHDIGETQQDLRLVEAHGQPTDLPSTGANDEERTAEKLVLDSCRRERSVALALLEQRIP